MIRIANGLIVDGTGKAAFRGDIVLEGNRIATVESVAPETVLTARELAENVWFLPMSALGHNPMQEGVRPADVKPIWAELPMLMALARRGLVPVAGGEK